MGNLSPFTPDHDWPPADFPGDATIETVPADALNPENRAFWLHLGTAVLVRGLIGIERQLRGKAAGIRTSILICLGTSIFVTLGASIPRPRPIRRACWRRW